ncbi:hypothetical protein GALL_544860 [mine drainage metagenome]|uniref:Helix-turn-helix domain-containing protein n=2 Tax=root TaxID=1 RepID=A0A1J5NYT6_9ZZZZ
MGNFPTSEVEAIATTLEQPKMHSPAYIPNLENMPTSAVLMTRDAAAALGKSGQTLRKLYCQQGHAYGIKPLKIGGRLAWRAADLLKLLRGGM